MSYINTGERLNSTDMRKLNAVAEEAEAAYSEAEQTYAAESTDPTGGGQSWSHDPRRRPQGNCRPAPTTKVEGAQFYKCTLH